jgi:dTDP-glucose 4,6-dehydratase
MNYLITGGAGFIGGNHIHHILATEPDCFVVCYDVLSYAGNLSTLLPVKNDSRFTFVKGDIACEQSVETLFSSNSFDIVINFAAETHVDRSIEKPGIFVHSNIAGTQVLMDACLRHGVKRYHQVSTDEVYGDLPFDRPELKFTEDYPLHASSPYSASKAAGDLLVKAYIRTFKLPASISRCSNNYGPYQYPEKLIPLMISKALADEPLPVYGEGRNVRDWLHVKDHCEAIQAIVSNESAVGSVFNVGGNCELANIDLVRHLLKLLGKSEDLITFVADRPGHDKRYAIDASKIQSVTGWKPRYNLFEGGLADTIEWYQSHTDWWKPLLSI